MKKEQLANLVSYLESIKDKNGDYKKYIESLDLLTNRLLDYYTPNIQGKYMDITQEEYDELDKCFNDAREKVEFYVTTGFADEENEEARELKKNINARIYKEILTDLYASFKQVEVGSGKSFYEEMQKVKASEVVKVDNDDVVEDKKVEAPEENKEEKNEVKEEKAPEENKNNREVGDISASNIVKDGFFQKDIMTVTYENEKVSGEFIYKTNYDPDKEIDALIQEYSLKYPEYKDYFQSLNNIDKISELGTIENSDMIDNRGNPKNFFNDKKIDLKDAAGFDNYKNEVNFLNANAEFILKLKPVLKEIYEYSIDLKASNGANLDRRNVAMSGIAKMFGHPEVVVNAKAVAIEKDIDGEKVYTEGTFIEEAKGKTIKEFSINDQVHSSKLDAWDTAEAKKSLANLQIMDYICGNKRDLNNIKFEFDSNNKLKGVVGINNEKSFFVPKPTKEIIGEEDYSDLDDIKVIDSDMATKIMAFEQAEFEATMVQYGLSKDEVHEAWLRVEKIQELIKEPKILDEKDNAAEMMHKNRLVIVNEKAWDKLSLNSLARNDNIFAKTVEAQKTLVSEMKVDETLNEKYKILNNSLKHKLLDADKFLDEARKNSPLFGTSKRYSNIIKALADYNNTIAPEEKSSKLDNLKGLVDVYKSEKVKDNVMDKDGNLLKNLSGKDLGRVNLVNKLDDFVKKAKGLENEVKEAKALRDEDDNKVDEFNAKYRLGKYQNYAKLYKNDKGQILINANILERERQNNIILTESAKKMVELSNGVDLDKYPEKKEQYNILKNYISESIKNYKEQLVNDYHHGAIPKEFFDYKNDRYDKKIFDFNDDEKMFAYENPESEIFKNSFQEDIGKEIGKDLGEENMVEMKDLSNKVELEIKEEELEA